MTLRTKMKTFYHSEQGRSMIEMLGTLAIMGVLSIGGIAGYGYAVTKYKANETMDELNNRAIVYATQLKDGDLFSGTALRNGEFGDKTALGYGVSATVSEYKNEFNVTLSEIPFEVCEHILKNYTIPAEISVNGNVYNDVDENIGICGEGNTNMVFAFNGDLSNDWETVEVSGGPNNNTNNNEITTVPSVTPIVTQTISLFGCAAMPVSYYYQYVTHAMTACDNRGGIVELSDVDCDYTESDEVNSNKTCAAFNFEQDKSHYYVIGNLPPSLLKQSAWSAYSECMAPYMLNKNSGDISLGGAPLNAITPLCWDDYRAMLAKSTETGRYTESTTGTSTITQTPTVTHSLSPEVTVTITETITETKSLTVTQTPFMTVEGETCHWSGWLDSSKPSYEKNSGDYETLDGICGEGHVENIQCRAAGFPDTPLEGFGQNVVCNTEVGLVCHNKDQKPSEATQHIPACINYEINVYCCE